MDSIKSRFTQIIYPRSYSKTHQQQQAHPAFHQTSRIWILQILKILDSTISPYLMKTNPWLLMLDLIESEAVPVKNNIYTIQCFLQQQVRFSHVENNISDKQSVVYMKQSVVSISRSRNRYNIRDFCSLNQFQRSIHKNQSILPLFVFTNRL